MLCLLAAIILLLIDYDRRIMFIVRIADYTLNLQGFKMQKEVVKWMAISSGFCAPQGRSVSRFQLGFSRWYNSLLSGSRARMREPLISPNGTFIPPRSLIMRKRPYHLTLRPEVEHLGRQPSAGPFVVQGDTVDADQG